MKGLIKKLGFASLMLVCFLLSYKMVVNASNITISAWYTDDTTEVGYWAQEPKVFFSNLNTSINISSYLDNAVKKWNAAGINSSITTTPSNANIKAYGGTRSQLISIGLYYGVDTLGLTSWDSSSTAATANNVYTIKKLTATSTSVCNEAGESYYTNIMLHEYGHALGWLGHTDNSNDVMWPYAKAANTNLTSNDINHLAQIYNAMN